MAQYVAEHIRLLGLVSGKQEALNPGIGPFTDGSTHLETRLLIGQRRHHHTFQANSSVQSLQ